MPEAELNDTEVAGYPRPGSDEPEKKQIERDWGGSTFNDQLLYIVLAVNVLLIFAVPALFVYNVTQNSRLDVLVGNAESGAIDFPLHYWAVLFCVSAVVFCGELFYSRYSEEEIDPLKWGFASTIEAEEEESEKEEEPQEEN